MTIRWTLAAALLAGATLAQSATAAGAVAIAVGPKHPAAAAALLGHQLTPAPVVLKEKADFGVIAASLNRADAAALGAAPIPPASQPARGPVGSGS